jgi:phospholipid/cholesterol/gamma-HCH transport system substrate-binding protein
MKTTGSQKAKIGIFTIAGFAILVAGIFIIGSKKNMFSDTFSIYGTFKNVGGLQIGNNIRFAGINVGTVDAIEIMNDTTIRVDMRIKSKVRPFLKEDAIASIGSDGLMGDKLVTISPGGNGEKLLTRGGHILTANPVDFDKIITKITHVADNAEIITASLASIANQISSGKGSIGKLIYTDDLQKGLVNTVNSAKTTMESAKKGTEGFAENMDALKHNFLLKGYYKKKAKEKQRMADSASGKQVAPEPKQTKKQIRKEAKETKKAIKEEIKDAKKEELQK